MNTLHVVQLNSSEYEAIKEAKEKAENEVRELKNTLEKFKDDSKRVVIKTFCKYPAIDFSIITKEIKRLIHGYVLIGKDIFNPTVNINYLKMRDLNSELYCRISDILRENIDYNKISTTIEQCESQFIGFDDRKQEVKNHYKKELEDSISRHNEAEANYINLRNSIQENVESVYINKINRLKETIKEKDEIIECAYEEISKLKAKKKGRKDSLIKYLISKINGK